MEFKIPDGIVLACQYWEGRDESYEGGIDMRQCRMCTAYISTSRLNFARVKAEADYQNVPVSLLCPDCAVISAILADDFQFRGMIRKGKADIDGLT